MGSAPSMGTGAICFIACVHPRESNELITPRKNFRDFREKRRSKIGFYFFTYEWSRRRLPSIKTNNEGEEVFVLPFSALDDEYLFWKYRLTRLKSEVIYSGKDSIRF